jgi:hypothetical protein
MFPKLEHGWKDDIYSSAALTNKNDDNLVLVLVQDFGLIKKGKAKVQEKMVMCNIL